MRCTPASTSFCLARQLLDQVSDMRASVSVVHVRHACACGMRSREVEKQGGVRSGKRKAEERQEEGQDTQEEGQDTQQRQTPDELQRQTQEEERRAITQEEQRRAINQRLLVTLSLSDMFHLFEPLGGGASWPEEPSRGRASGLGFDTLGRARGLGIDTGHHSGHLAMSSPLHAALHLWQVLAEDAAGSRDMTAVWWLSNYALFLSCAHSSSDHSDPSVHPTRQHPHRAPGLAGHRGDLGEEGGGTARARADEMPCHLYHPDGAHGEGGASWQGRALGLQVPATIVLLQRLVLTECAVLSRQITQAQETRAGGKASGAHEDGWRVERVVCLAHAACWLAACLGRYHHTLYLFFKVT